MKKKIGVYVCHCGTNISDKVDVARIAEKAAAENEEVVVARHYKYMCSEPGQKMIRDDIRDLGLDYVVEASCTPKMHEPTFRNAVSQAGLNPYQFEMVNIREHCSWVTADPEQATRKAEDLIRGGIARVRHHVPLQGSRKPVTPAALVVGGGIAGITAALKIAKAGHKVYLVEKTDIIGGRMAQFDKTFPTLDCAGCTLTPKTSEVGRHPNIEILTKTEVVELSGFVGNFKARLRQKPRYVDLKKCTGCADCQKVCPIDINNDFELGLATRHPISRAFPQAIPNTYAISRLGAPPCQAACPAGINIAGVMSQAGLGRYGAALSLVRQQMPFAAICGRICHHPCETACKRGQLDQPLAIADLERFLGDWELERGAFSHPPLKESREEKVAIVGAGPAGLAAAYFLTLEGYPVTVFEKRPFPGGMLAAGIPEDRLPRPVLAAEIANLEKLGVTIETGKTLGQDLTFDSLEKEGFKAVFLAIGLHPSLPQDQNKEDIEGVMAAAGRTVDPDLPAALGLKADEQGRIVSDEQTLATSRPGVFAGGECTLGPAGFVEAVAQGKKAAESIGSFLEPGGLRQVKPPEQPMDAALTLEEKKRARPIERQQMPVLSPEQRTESFAEVRKGFTKEMAREEGRRCLSCSLCVQCGLCAKVCGPKAIDLNEQERTLELPIGAVIVATGIDIFEAEKYPEYGYGKYPDVITNLQYERLCNSAGPTSGQVLRPSNGQVPQSVVFIQCVGSRDRARGFEYCSKVCCMISAKQLALFKHHNPEGQAYVFYIDNRAGGKGYEEFLRRAIEESQAQYIRGRVAKVFEEAGRLVVRGENSLAGGPLEVEADLVVLATGLTAQRDYRGVSRTFNIPTDKYGFFIESHPKLGPVETALSGIYLAGAAQGPKDIPESVAQGGAAAAEALALFSLGQVEVEPTISFVDPKLCTGCKTCVDLCAYKAITFSDLNKQAAINEALCQGCGTCGAACPMGAIQVCHYTPEQIFSQIEGILA
ncbi:MAG: FAD-dependent oxidoreductase [Pseudomonadota bacterium]